MSKTKTKIILSGNFKGENLILHFTVHNNSFLIKAHYPILQGIMNKSVFLTLSFLVLAVFSFGKSGDTKQQLQSKKELNTNDARYNTVCLIPKLYKENKQDSIESIIKNYEKNYGERAYLQVTPVIVPYEIVSRIKNRTFKEEIRNISAKDADGRIKLSDAEFYEENIFSYLEWYLTNFDIRTKTGQYKKNIRVAYGDYFDFMRSFAKKQLDKPGLSAVETFLLNFFAHPSFSMYAQLEGTDFDGTILQKAWEQYSEQFTGISGVNIALISGLWVPQGNLALLGNHPYIGCTPGYRKNRLMADINFNIRWINAPNTYIIIANNYKYRSTYFFGTYAGLDCGYRLFGNRNEIDLLGGVAWDGFNSFQKNSNNTNSDNNTTKIISTLNLNAGLCYRFFVSHKVKNNYEYHSYLALQAKYNFLHYNNAGGTNLDGNAFSIGLAYGWYSRKGIPPYCKVYKE